jgi:beta-glucanase (GH16 family)
MRKENKKNTIPSFTTRIQRLYDAHKNNTILATLAVVVVIAVGSIMLLTKASGFFAASEAELGTKTANAVAVADTTASGGSAVKFTASSSGTACATGEIGTPPNCYPAPPGPLATGKHWNVIFNDDFNGSSLDTTKWSPCFDWNSGSCTSSFNNGREHYQASQVQISNGTAKLVAEPLSPPFSSTACYQDSCTYKAGLISTARPIANSTSKYLFPFTYGYVESRMKYPAHSGFFTAFWMLPTNTSYTYRSEIDIVEILGGDPNTIFMTYHYSDRTKSYKPNTGDHNNGACQVKDYSTDFVRFGMDWEPTYIAWYINGVKCGQFNGDTTTIENGPMQMILHMMIDNDWERSWGLTLSDLTQKDQLEVDYVRIYQQQ